MYLLHVLIPQNLESKENLLCVMLCDLFLHFECRLCSLDLATYSLDLAPYSLDLAPYSLDLATCSLELATYSLDLETHSLDLATCSLDLATCSLDLATCSLEHWAVWDGKGNPPIYTHYSWDIKL